MSNGELDGEICGRNGCDGILKLEKVEGCSCHISPPCSACLSAKIFCPKCGWFAEDKKEVYCGKHEKVVANKCVSEPLYHQRVLEDKKIDYQVFSHSNCSQKCVGVYPDGTTSLEVEDKVRGTFGGRFESFGNGKFVYIAYTD